MATKYIIRKRQNTILYMEFFLAALATGVVAFTYYKLHPATALLMGIGSMFLFAVLFFANSILRYLFSILFSLGWALLAFVAIVSVETKSDITAWVFAIIAFAMSIWVHWDHFNFIRHAQVYEYEVH
jgi:hypothetical protein